MQEFLDDFDVNAGHIISMHKFYGATPSQSGASAQSTHSQAAPAAPQTSIVGAEPKAAAPQMPMASSPPPQDWDYWNYMAQQNQAPWMAQQYPAPWQPMAPM
eukprot:GEMP01142882.1.p2 GENE.GEMP01142882.1~~GEMP01142882.1.p2  ORF type:complete len:102 (+),score=26.60 GEMP01142882.1:105-410(+)